MCTNTYTNLYLVGILNSNWNLIIYFAGFILGTLLEQIYDSNYILNIQQGVLICACAHGITYLVLGF
jgi:hypothetical protein